MASKVKNPKDKVVSKIEESAVNEKAIVLAEHASCLVDRETSLRYFDIDFSTIKPVGGEFDNEEEMRIKIPKMKLLNANSVELKKSSRVEGAEEGLFYNVLTQELAETLEIVALFKFRERYFMVPTGSNNQVCSSRDGRGKFGVSLQGAYKQYSIPTAFVQEAGVDIEVGICKNCPQGMRDFGHRSACQMVDHLVCVSADYISSGEEILDQIAKGNKVASAEILRHMFTLPFKSTGLPKLDVILQTAYVTGMYFSQTWRIGSAQASNESYEWQNYTVNSGRQLTDNERIFAFSLSRFARKLRPVITDLEVMEGRPSNTVNPPTTDVNIQ